MKPGEFVGADGLVYGVIQAIRVFEMAHGGHSAGVVCIDHPDFPAAVAALQSLIQPKPTVPLAGVHPAVGLRWCGEEGHGEEFIYLNADWRMRFYDKADHFCGPWDLERRTDNGWDARVEPGPSIALLAFQAGRAYERWQS